MLSLGDGREKRERVERGRETRVMIYTAFGCFQVMLDTIDTLYYSFLLGFKRSSLDAFSMARLPCEVAAGSPFRAGVHMSEMN